MIFMSAAAKDSPFKYPAAIQEALDWIAGHDVGRMDAGKYEIKGSDIYINIQDITTKPVEEAKPERHDKYLDIQYVISGVEKMGFVPYTGEESVQVYEEAKDRTIYKDLKDENFVEVQPGGYCIFFSNDIHRPGCAAGSPARVRKAVVKIREELL